MLSTALLLFAAGVITILLPCILPLVPIVVGVSVVGQNRWRPLLTVMGMVVSFVGFTYLLQVALAQFPQVADIARLATYEILLLFGVGFLTDRRDVRLLSAIAGAFFFLSKGWIAVVIAAILGIIAVEIAGRIASRLQQLGADVQQQARERFGAQTFLTSFIIGLTLGLVWVPCAGPALGFVLALIRERPGLEALLLLKAYALGTAVPLLIVGYGGQWAVRSVRALNQYSGRIKQVAGVMLILSALAFQFDLFISLQTSTGYGSFGMRLEEELFGAPSGSPSIMDGGMLPILGTAPEFKGLGPWFNSEPLTLKSLEGKIVLVDFWTYSCINCIRTLPYIQGYWEKYRDQAFVVVGVHAPEFAFERLPENVQAAIKKYELTYPVALDNDFATWNAFKNRYWPAKYLIDAEGRVRYVHFGEGAYAETDAAIRGLLREVGAELSSSVGMEPTSDSGGHAQTPETYLGSRSWEAFGNAEEPSERTIEYTAPATLALHQYALVGQWQLVDDERQVLRGDSGEIRLRFLGSEANLVMGSEGTNRIEADVQVDGGKPRPFRLTGDDLYPLFSGDYGEHELILRIRGKGAEAYAFTFGS